MKKVIKVIFVFILVNISVGLIIMQEGYQQYQNVIQQTPIEEKVKQIQSQKDYTTLSEMPPIYLEAVVAIEDHRFYEHRGIDFIAIGRAILHDIKAMSFVEGGSTITQQLAKNSYFSQEKKIERKIAEALVAFDLEKKYSKQEILELYLNTSYFGEGYEKVKQASRGYFGKEPKQMNDSECIMLAGVPNAPSVYNPNVNPELARQRQKQVLKKMVKYKKISQEKADKILQNKR